MLAGLLEGCPDALRADFQRVYGLDLDSLWTGGITVSRAADLAANLPAGSMAWVAVDSPASWTVGDYMLAGLMDTLNLMCWDGKGAQPERIPRPGSKHDDSDDRMTFEDPSELLAYLNQPGWEDMGMKRH